MHRRHSYPGGVAAVRTLRRWVFLAAAGVWLAACSTPVGIAPNLRGTYWEHALVTNPYGGGPQIVIWGPPDPSVPDYAG